MKYDCILVVTDWGAVLQVIGWEYASSGLIRVKAPNAIDAGQYIHMREVQTMLKVKLLTKDHPPMYTDREWSYIAEIF